MSFILDNFGTINAYRHARDWILSTIKSYIKNGAGGLPVSREQAYVFAKEDMAEELQNISNRIAEYHKQLDGIKKYIDFKTEKPTAAFLTLPAKEKLATLTTFSKIYKNELPNARMSQQAFRKALGHNVKTQQPIFFEIVKNEYRNWNTFSEQELNNRLKLSEIEDELIRAQVLTDLSQSALREQIEENENVDPGSKMSDKVKDFLSDITYEDENGAIKSVTPGFAFLKMLETFLKLHVNGTTSDGNPITLSDIVEQVDYIKTRYINSKAEEAVLDTLVQQVITPAMSADPNSLYDPKRVNIVMHQLPGSKTASYHLVYYNEAEAIIEGEERVSLENVTTLQEAQDLAKKNKDIQVISLPANNIDLGNLYDAALDAKRVTNPEAVEAGEEAILEPAIALDPFNLGEDTLAARQSFFDMYQRLEARNLFAEMQTLFGSQKETHLMIAQTENKYGEISIKYISAKELGIRVNIRRELTTRVAEFHDSLIARGFQEGIKTFLSEKEGAAFIKKLNSSIPITKMSAIEDFMSFLGMQAYATTPTASEIGDIAKAIEELLKDVKENLGKVKEVPAVEQDGTVEDDKVEKIIVNIDDILADQGDRLNTLSKYLSQGTELARASSVKDAEGKPIYKYNNSHYQYEIFNLLHQISSDVFKGGGKSRQYLNKYVPEFIKTAYFQQNIFTRGINTIRSTVAYHDAISEKDSGFTTTLDAETPYDRYTREFSAGFVSLFKNSKGKYYRQFFYPPSHRSKVLNVELGVMSPEQVLEGIKAAITQFKQEESYFDQIKNYGTKDYTNFSILQRTLDKYAEQNITIDTSIDVLADLVYEELAIVAKETAQHIIDNKVALPADLGISQKIAEENKLLDYDILESIAEKKMTRVLPDKFKTREFNSQKQEVDYLASLEDILPMVHLFVSNSYINGFFANQLALGDNRFYKGGDDIVKRNAGTSAAGQIGMFNSVFGLPPKFRMGVLGDSIITPKDNREFLAQFLEGKELEEVVQYFSDKDVDITDAQGFMLPSRWQHIQKAFGRAYGTANVMKPVHFQNLTK